MGGCERDKVALRQGYRTENGNRGEACRWRTNRNTKRDVEGEDNVSLEGRKETRGGQLVIEVAYELLKSRNEEGGGRPGG